MAKYYDNDILDSTDWGGDESTGGLPVSGRSIQKYLKGKLKSPFRLFEDTKEECFRFFLSDQHAKEWFEERDLAKSEGRAMNALISSYEFSGNAIPGTPNYSASIQILHGDGENTIEGSTGNYIAFRPLIEDRSKNDTKESIDIYINISNNGENKPPIYLIKRSNTIVQVNIDDYIKLGDNDIIITIKGRANGVSKTIVMTYSQFRLQIESGFNISQTIVKNTDFSVNCNIQGNGQKEVRFYIDGKQVANKIISSQDTNANISQLFTNKNGQYTPGKHTLQIYAISNGYPSDLLYYEFVIGGMDETFTTCLVQYRFPPGTEPFAGDTPVFTGEQYVTQKLVWAYYTNDSKVRNPKITWRLYDSSGVETHLTTRTADIVEAETNKMPDPIEFIPSGYGLYKLQALIEGYDYLLPDRHIKDVYSDHTDPIGLIACYTISLIKNTNGVEEAVEGLEFKISGLGRSNDEPDSTRTDLSYNGIMGQFYNMPWNNRYGYYENAVVFGGGAYYRVNSLNPIDGAHDIRNNGCTIEIDFSTYEVRNENAILFQIGEKTGTHLIIYPTKIEFKTDLGVGPELRFRSTERHKICIVINPDTELAGNKRRFIELYSDGIRSATVHYGTTDSLVVNDGGILIGDPNGEAGIKLYYLRTYNQVIQAYNELNNFIIDSNYNIAALVKRNDIYIEGSKNSVSVDKLKSILPVWEFTGPLDRIVTSSDKITMTVSGKYTDTEHPDLYLEGDYIEIKTAGQSSLSDKMVKGLHVKFNKGKNQIKNSEGKPYYGNRWTPFPGNCPERKIRLNADGLESSHSHNMCLQNLINEVFPKVQINGEYVLRTPAQKYVLEGDYSKDMAKVWGGDPSEYTFPYKINYVSDWKPVAVVWRPDENTPYELYGIFSMGEEKKSDYSHGRHSIYLKKPLDNGQLDPFDMQPGEKGERGFDNNGIVQIETVRDSELTFMVSTNKWNFDYKNDYEKVYTDEDDLDLQNNNREWKLFKDEVVKPVADLYQGTRKNNKGIPYAYGNQDGFHKLFFGGRFNIWSFIAARSIIRKCGLTDTLVRNSQWLRLPKTYLSTSETVDNREYNWWFSYWDLDMAFGLQQPSGALVIEPGLSRDDKIGDNFVFTGKRVGAPESSWFWDAFDKEIELGKQRLATAITEQEKINAQKENLHYMSVQLEDALDDAGFNVANLLKQMKETIDKFGEALYNSDGEIKYLNSYADGADYLLRLQGSRLSHLNWWAYESFEKWNAEIGTKAYQTNAVSIRLTKNSDESGIIKLKAGAPSYFGWGLTSTVMESGIRKSTGDKWEFDLAGRALNANDPLKIYMPNKLEELDLSSMAHRIGGNIEFNNFYNEGTGIYIRKINIGVPKESMKQNIYNTFSEKTWTGLTNLTTLEEFNIQGHQKISSDNTIDISKMSNLKNLYLAGANGFTSLQPAAGVHIQQYELPISLQSLVLTSCTIDPNGITWWDGPNKTTLPTNLRTLHLTQGMGYDYGAHQLFKEWLDMVSKLSDEDIIKYQVNYTNVEISNMNINQIMTLARMRLLLASSVNISGYFKCTQEYTTDQMQILMDAFGSDIFNRFNYICFDCNSTNVIISAIGSGVSSYKDTINEVEYNVIEVLQGTNAQFKSVGFPIVESKATYTWYFLIDGTLQTNAPGTDYIILDENRFNTVTSELITIESPRHTTDYELLVEKVTPFGINSGTALVRVKERTYPESAEIHFKGGSVNPTYDLDGTIQFSEKGHYIFDIKHLPIGYSGTLKNVDGGIWELDGVDETMASSCTLDFMNGVTPFEQFHLQVKNLPNDDLRFKLKYKSQWKNDLVIEATPLEILLLSIIQNALVNSQINGNTPLYAAVNQAIGKPGLPQITGAFNSMELKQLKGNVDITELLNQLEIDPYKLKNTNNGKYNVLQFFKNVTGLNLNNTGLDFVDISVMNRLQNINLEGTYASIKI